MVSPYFWTGVGSREIPPAIFVRMMLFGYNMAKQGGTLRSGKAIGSDEAFQLGHELWFRETNSPFSHMEIYTVNDYEDKRKYLSPFEIDGRHTPCWSSFCIPEAQKIHPIKTKLKGKSLHLHARNILQVVGELCITPSDFCIYYTGEDHFGNLTGGTATAANFARNLQIQSYNILTDKGHDYVRQLWINCTDAKTATDGFKSGLRWAHRVGDSKLRDTLEVGIAETGIIG